MNDTTTIQERIAAGIAFLDKRRPGWDKKLDLPSLDLNSCSKCVLGQVFGDYYAGRDRLGITGFYECVDRGFTLELDGYVVTDSDPWQDLTDAWVEALHEKWGDT